jgi:5'-AMP-activated protein kinase catalytic alpha subunit
MTEVKREKKVADYILERSIGEGTFGKVKLGKHTITGEKVAIKILEKDKICDVSDVERVAREIHILKLIRHPNIVQLYEIIETPKQLYLIMEYASGGELFDHIVARTRLSEPEACKFYQHIVSGIEYIHRLNVVHRDLKPENLLLDHNGQIKIVDFGLSNTYRPEELLKTACGSPCYAAPEMIAGKSYNGLLADLWSSGVILFAMVCGYLPFEDPNTSDLYKKILSGDYKCPKFLSAEARDFLACILNTDPQQRYNIANIRAHPWFNLAQQDRSPGILVGYEQIPVDHSILANMEELGFRASYVQKCIEASMHNSEATTYYLLLKKLLKDGGVSVGDIAARNFIPVSLANKMSNPLQQIMHYIPKPPLPKTHAEGKSFRRRKPSDLMTRAKRTESTWSSSVEQELKLMKLGIQKGHIRKNSVPTRLRTPSRAPVSSTSPRAKAKSRRSSVNASFNVNCSKPKSVRSSRPCSNLGKRTASKRNPNKSASSNKKSESFLDWVRSELATSMQEQC